jgi:hypothetical protein
MIASDAMTTGFQPTTAEPVLLQRTRRIVRDLRRAISERTAAENELATVHLEKAQAAEDAWKQAKIDLNARQERQLAESEAAYKERKQKFAAAAHTELEGTKRRLQNEQDALDMRHRDETAGLQKAYEDARWSTKTVYEGDKVSTQEAQRVKEHEARTACQKLQNMCEEAAEFLRKWKQRPEYADVPDVKPPPTPLSKPPQELLNDKVKKGEGLLAQLEGLILPRLGQWRYVSIFSILLAIILTIPIVWAFSLPWFFYLFGIVAAGVISFALYTTIHQIAAWQCRRIVFPLGDLTAEALAIEPFAVKEAEVATKRKLKELQDKKNEDLAGHDASYVPQIKDQKVRFEEEARNFTASKEKQLADMQARFKAEIDRIESEYTARKDQIVKHYQADVATGEAKHQHDTVDVRQRYKTAREGMVKAWHHALDRARKESQSVAYEAARLSPDWDEWQQLPTPETMPDVISFGTLTLDVSQLTGGVPTDEELKAEPPLRLTLPALAPFPTKGNVLLKAQGAGKTIAVQTLQTLMMRFLTELPAGKARLTIFDPVGLGDNFAAFMHLADYDEALIAHRIWTEEHHFEQRLVDLTGHMESIIQKYLRNQYPSIEAYNQDAGEVAEPFRLLTVANYPANFNTEAAKRLLSIVASGARCGVSTFLSMDTAANPVRDVNLTALEENCLVFEYTSDTFHWADPDFRDLPLVLLPPPTPDRTTELLKTVGSAARDAARVEVPFRLIHPGYDELPLWHADSAAGLTIPLGRVGATRRQALTLGHGTAQHVLIAGKTGSGKSTLLNIIITNAALHYSPDQLEMYLIDFKKGVEFKAYASHALPHARVVAVESEREFGLSVLQKLDAELKRRGERFRDLGVANIKDARTADTKALYPRILLIVDEFQEFFVEDDRLAQEAALLLDRLVRQGRAFGIHVILGSQTLGGAYTLARSTIDQMAVRIVLSCSEADGHLILGDDNHAARLLSRPGEAIYNDASGRVEGNHPFQVCWLDDDEREVQLQDVRQHLAVKPTKRALVEPIVFEGNAPAELLRSRPLRAALDTVPATPVKEPQAYLGEAIAIKDATTATFKRQSGSQLLILGQDERGAVGLLGGAMVSLAAQHPSDTAKFYFLAANFDIEPVNHLHQVVQTLPHDVVTGQHRDVPTVIQSLADELVARKAQPPDAKFSPIFVIIYGLHRLRDLRRNEDEFGMSEGGANPAAQLAEVVKEGAPLGIHVLIWVDSATGATRSFDRQTMREFMLRVLFQMSANDSSNLIDSPAAGKLGAHRALFYAEELGTLEKCRPYGVPNEETIAFLREKFAKWHGPRS